VHVDVLHCAGAAGMAQRDGEVVFKQDLGSMLLLLTYLRQKMVFFLNTASFVRFGYHY
jgi:hypothetical protein